MSESPSPPQTLEKNLEHLEHIVGQLEKGDLDLEKGIKLFEEGIIIYKSCRKQIDHFEKKINKLTEGLKEERVEID